MRFYEPQIFGWFITWIFKPFALLHRVEIPTTLDAITSNKTAGFPVDFCTKRQEEVFDILKTTKIINDAAQFHMFLPHFRNKMTLPSSLQKNKRKRKNVLDMKYKDTNIKKNSFVLP